MCLKLSAQVGVNTSSPDNSSVLDIYSVDKGLLLPRVSLTSVNSITSPINNPAIGLLIWNTNPNVIDGSGIGYYYFNGTKWMQLQSRNTLDQQYDHEGNGQGRIIVADAGAVRIDGTDGLMITGTFGSGSLIDSDVSGAGTRMFFYPKKAAFRSGSVTGTAFNDATIGNYSSAVGFNNSISGSRTFGANFNNVASTANDASIGSTNNTFNNNSFSSGFTTRAGGDNAFSSGSNTYALGYNSFANGIESRSSGINEFTLGHYPTLAVKTNSSGTIGIDSQSTFYTTDRAFAIGNGNSTLRHNAFEVWKNGRVMINGNYSLPIADGTNKQKLTTSGTGTVTFNSRNTTQIPLYSDNTGMTFGSTILNDVIGVEAGIIPSLTVTSGNVRVKLVIRYTSLTGTPSFRLRVHDGTTQLTPITTATVWTNTPSQVGGVIESAWRNWSAGTNLYEAHLSGVMANAGESIVISNCYLLIASQ